MEDCVLALICLTFLTWFVRLIVLKYSRAEVTRLTFVPYYAIGIYLFLQAIETTLVCYRLAFIEVDDEAVYLIDYITSPIYRGIMFVLQIRCFFFYVWTFTVLFESKQLHFIIIF